MIPRKHLLDPPVLSVGDTCQVEWLGDQYTATLLAMGDESTANEAEMNFLKAIDDDDSASDQENQPPKKKRQLFKSLTKKAVTSTKKKTGTKTSTTTQKKGKGRKKPLYKCRRVRTNQWTLFSTWDLLRKDCLLHFYLIPNLLTKFRSPSQSQMTLSVLPHFPSTLVMMMKFSLLIPFQRM